MRTCPNCGATVAETDDFCGNCGTYLGWLQPDPSNGADQPTGPGPATPTGPAPTSAAPGATSAGSGRTSTGPGATSAASGSTSTGPGATSAAPGTTSAGPGAVPGRGATATGPGATAEPTPTIEQPGAVAPARPVTRRARPSTQATEGPVNGPPCTVCGTANPVGARFCRRCAAPLTAPADTGARERKRWRWPWRGSGGSPWPRRIVVVVVLALLAVGGFLLYPFAGRIVEDVRDKLSTPEPVGPSRVVATEEVPGHPVTAAVDDATNRYWGAPQVGDAAEFGFGEPFRLVGLVIHTGAATNREVFEQQARPSVLAVEVTTSDGTTTTVPVTLADQPGPQRVDTGISDVVSIRVVIRAAAGLTPGRHIALGEIEFFRRP